MTGSRQTAPRATLSGQEATLSSQEATVTGQEATLSGQEAALSSQDRPGLTERWLRLAAARIAERRAWLTELDAAIGDGDHGINLARGFREVLLRLDDPAVGRPSGASALELAGRTITGTVGGASGALYGRALLRAAGEVAGGGSLFAVTTATAPGGAATVSPRADGATGPVASTAGEGRVRAVASAWADGAVDLRDAARAARALRAAVDGVAALGRATVGEKTMLDALVPAVTTLEQRAGVGADLCDALVAAADAAEAGAAATIPLLATKGRASYLGERSIGHLDPGAASSAILLRALADAALEDAAQEPGR